MMSDIPEWKSNWIEAIEESMSFFSNANKIEREKWVVSRILENILTDFSEDQLEPADEPSDVVFRDARFQVKEILETSRRRGDEYNSRIEQAVNAKEPEDLMSLYDPQDISVEQIFKNSIDYSQKLIKKYGPFERKKMDLVIYHNFNGHNEIPPFYIPPSTHYFRSLCIVSNGYRSVIYASSSAPEFLRANVGRIWNLEGNEVYDK